MRSPFVVPLLGLCLLTSCRRNEPTGAAPPPGEHFDALGGTTISESGANFAFRAFQYQKGDRLVVAGFAEWPGRAAGPAFLVCCRLPDADRPTSSGKSASNSGGSHILFEHRFTPARGGTCEIRYEVKGW